MTNEISKKDSWLPFLILEETDETQANAVSPIADEEWIKAMNQTMNLIFKENSIKR